MAEETRLAGTLIGSVLESTGYHYQEAVLEAFQAPFENEVGGLLYILAIVLAITYTATQGGFKMSAWLLIGPPLFFSIIQVQQTIPNARWEFSEQTRNNEEGDAARQEADEAQEAQASVSMVFAKYVEMISATVSSIVSTISDGRENADLWFLIKAELYAATHTSESSDVGLTHLIHHGLLINCAEVVYWARAIEDPIFRDFDPNDPLLPVIASQIQKSKDFFAPSKQNAQENFDRAYKETRFNVTEESARYLAAQVLPEGFSFEELESETKRIQDKTFSCQDVWRAVIDGILNDSGDKYKTLMKTAEDHGIPEDTIKNLFLQANGIDTGDPLVFDEEENGPDVGGPEVNRIVRIIALYHLRNESRRPDMGSWISQMAGRHEARLIRTQLDGESSMYERSRLSVLEWAEKERLIHSAASLPYYQGLLLYLLGTTFPFFALLLLIPGKHTGFLMWFALWFWVKSWDIGFAIVMLLDDLLFALFAIEQQDFGKVRELQVGSEEADMKLTMASLAELDPTFQLATYYSLVGVALMAVPIASAQIFLGTMAQGAGLIEKGSRAFSDNFADSAHHHMVRDANTAMRNEASLLLKQKSQVKLRNALASSKLAQARGTALEMGISPEEIQSELARAGTSQNLPDYASPSTVPQPQVSGQDLAAGIQQKKQSGFLTGFTSDYKPLGGSQNLADSALNVAAYAAGVKVDDARANAILEVYKAELSYERARLQWTAIHEELRDLHMRTAPMGILPLPPSGDFYGGEPSQEEFGISMNQFQSQQKQRKAVVETYGSIATEFFKVAQQYAEDKKWKPIRNMSDLSTLSPNQRQQIADHARNLAWVLPALGLGSEYVKNLSENSGGGQAAVQTFVDDQRQVINDDLSRMVHRVQELANEPLAQQNTMFYERPTTPEENFLVERNRFHKYELPTEKLKKQNQHGPGSRSLYDNPEINRHLETGLLDEE